MGPQILVGGSGLWLLVPVLANPAYTYTFLFYSPSTLASFPSWCFVHPIQLSLSSSVQCIAHCPSLTPSLLPLGQLSSLLPPPSFPSHSFIYPLSPSLPASVRPSVLPSLPFPLPWSPTFLPSLPFNCPSP